MSLFALGPVGSGTSDVQKPIRSTYFGLAPKIARRSGSSATYTRSFSSVVRGRRFPAPFFGLLTEFFVRPVRRIIRSVSRLILASAFATSLMMLGDSTAFGDGPFLFGPPQVITMPTPHSPTAVAVGDVDGDGDVDVVVPGRNSEGFAYLMLNDDGVLGTPIELVTGGQTDWVEIVDLDGDGHLDLCFAVRALRGRLSILHGNGDGTFGEFEEIALGREPRAVVVDDLDGDGDPDIAAMNHRLPIIEILLNDGEGGFDPAAPLVISRSSVSIPFPQSIGTADFDADGDRDLVIVATGASRIFICRNRGDATFDPAEGWRPSRVNGQIGGMTDLAVGDLDQDGDEDVLVPLILIGESSHVGIFENQGSTASIEFDRDAAFPSTGLGYAYAAAMGDLDGDEDLDVIVGHALPGPVMVLDNRTEPISAGGDGVIRFEPPQQIANDSFFRGLAVADLDGDCDLDVLAVELVSNSLWVLPNLTPQASGCGDGFVGRVAAPVDSRVSSVSPGFDRAQVADLDGDGVVSGADIALFLTRMRSGETPRGEPVRGPIESRRR